MPFAPAPSSKSCVICRWHRVYDFFLQVCPICALGAHLLFCRIAIAAGELRARPKWLQRVTRPPARARRRDPPRHATGAGVLPPNPHTSFARSDSPCPLAASLRSRGARTAARSLWDGRSGTPVGHALEERIKSRSGGGRLTGARIVRSHAVLAECVLRRVTAHVRRARKTPHALVVAYL